MFVNFPVVFVQLFAFGPAANLENGKRKFAVCEYVRVHIALHVCTHVQCMQEHALMHCVHVANMYADLVLEMCLFVLSLL